MVKATESKWDQRPLPPGPIGPNPMRRRFEPKPRRWRLAFWRKAKQ